MPAWAWILITVGVVLVIALVMAATVKRDRSKKLQEKFGPEYERTLDKTDSRKEAERELAGRAERRSELDIRPLSEAAADAYATSWRDVQTRFVDEPSGAVVDADRLVTDVMRDRGYPMEDFDEQADVISVDHPGVVEDYRQAHAVVVAHGRGGAGTEDLRQAMVHYRSLFDELLGPGHSVTNGSGSGVR